MKNKEKANNEPSWIERLVIRKIYRITIKKIENMKGSWKTSLLGWIVLLGVTATALKNLLDGDPSTVFDLNSVLAALKDVGIGIPAGIGLIFARDNDKTSEDVKAKK